MGSLLDTLDKLVNIGTAIGALIGFVLAKVLEFHKDREERKQKLIQDQKDNFKKIGDILSTLQEDKPLHARKFYSNQIKLLIDGIESAASKQDDKSREFKQEDIIDFFLELHITITATTVDYAQFADTANNFMNQLNELIK